MSLKNLLTDQPYVPRYIAFLRGINLGKRRLPMTRLKELFEELGFEDVSTFIASGNVIFSAEEKNGSRLEERISEHLERSLGYKVDTFVRTDKDVARVARATVFSEAELAKMTIHVVFLQKNLPPATARKLAKVRTKDDEFRISVREFYWLCRVKVIDSKVWSLPEVRELRLPTLTMRNMTSVRKLAAKYGF